MNEAKRIELELFGESYSVISDEPTEQVFEVAKTVDDLMRLIARRTGLSDVKKIAVLTALKLATTQHKLEQDQLDSAQACEELVKKASEALR